MKKIALLSALALVAAAPFAGADEAVRAAQASLQRTGYYTGALDGELNADTAAALRRYQIRNELEPTGKLDAATSAALRRESGAAAQAAAPAVPSAPPATPGPKPIPMPVVTPPAPVDARYAGLFVKTPFENAAPEAQAATVRKAQGILAAGRFYSGPADGIPGPAFEEALIRYQSTRKIPRTGRLDIDTLAAMRLLPVAKIRRPRVAPEPYVPRVPDAPAGAVRGVPLD